MFLNKKLCRKQKEVITHAQEKILAELLVRVYVLKNVTYHKLKFTKREEKFTRNVFWMMLDDYDTTKTFLIGRARVDHVPHYAAGI